jgi:predicted DCC family thiol-disulfide oxidoreductase YuxK
MFKNIILYDGECGLCNRSVQFILKHERNQNLQFTSLQSSFSKKIFSDFNIKTDFDESILFYRDGKLVSKSKAVLLQEIENDFRKFVNYRTLINQIDFWIKNF